MQLFNIDKIQKHYKYDFYTCNKSKIDFPGVQKVELVPYMIQSIKMQMKGKYFQNRELDFMIAFLITTVFL